MDAAFEAPRPLSEGVRHIERTAAQVTPPMALALRLKVTSAGSTISPHASGRKQPVGDVGGVGGNIRAHGRPADTAAVEEDTMGREATLPT